MLSCRRGQEVYKRWIEREREPRRKTYAGIIYCRKMLQEHFPKLKLILTNDSAKVILGGKRHFPLFLSRVFSFLKKKKIQFTSSFVLRSCTLTRKNLKISCFYLVLGLIFSWLWKGRFLIRRPGRLSWEEDMIQRRKHLSKPSVKVIHWVYNHWDN